MPRPELLVLALVLAPVSLVLLVALLRGYSVLVIFRRDRDRDR